MSKEKSQYTRLLELVLAVVTPILISAGLSSLLVNYYQDQLDSLNRTPEPHLISSLEELQLDELFPPVHNLEPAITPFPPPDPVVREPAILIEINKRLFLCSPDQPDGLETLTTANNSLAVMAPALFSTWEEVNGNQPLECSPLSPRNLITFEPN